MYARNGTSIQRDKTTLPKVTTNNQIVTCDLKELKDSYKKSRTVTALKLG